MTKQRLTRKSSSVVLVLSGALLTGCDSSPPPPEATDWSTVPTYTNNTYMVGRGYYHAPYHGWFAFPYNHYDNSRGYFHGGRYTTAPHVSPLTASKPTFDNTIHRTSSSRSSPVTRGGFTSSSFRSGIS